MDLVENIYEQLQQDEEKVNKYQRAGVYSISIKDKVVYVGKSMNMLRRLAEHIAGIQVKPQTANKYKVLAQAKAQSIPISFGVIYYAKSKRPYTEILKVEAKYINYLRPPLNVQIPNPHNYKEIHINEMAYYITLEDIMGN